MMLPHCLDEKSETPRAPWVLSQPEFHDSHSVHNPRPHDPMGCPDWAFLSPLLKRSTVSIIRVHRDLRVGQENTNG